MMETHHKITKPRSRMVKPILKKLSHSEKNSLDLDRGWDEQAGSHGWGGGLYESAGAGRSAKDVSFIFGEPTAAPVMSSSVTTGGAGGPTRPLFQHGRSPSGTSHVSVATNSSGGPLRAGSFVHPFQQTPRTSTPPLLSYANSMASFDCGPRDYSPTITENDDGDDVDLSAPASLSNQLHHHHRTHSSSLSQSGLRRPSLASQRTSSFSDATTPGTTGTGSQPLRINTKQVASRRGPGKLSSSLSHSDLHLNLNFNLTTSDSPISSTLNGNQTFFPTSSSSQAPSSSIISPVSLSASVAPMSPLRSSLDGFRLRSRSEVDTWDRADTVREARRRFEERERAKDEKREREASKKQERREQKEAKVLEKAQAAQLRKNSHSSTNVQGMALPRRPPPAASKASSPPGSTPPANKISSDSHGGFLVGAMSADEKRLDFLSSNYDSVEGGRTPRLGGGIDDVHFQSAGPRRGTGGGAAAKRKTQGYWTGFILWLRTRLFRLGKT